MMKCPHCGEDLPEGFVFIPPEEHEEVTQDTVPANDDAIYPPSPADSVQTDLTVNESRINSELLAYYKENEEKKKKLPRIIASCAAAAAAVILIAVLAVSLINPKLKYDITGEWRGGDDFISSSTLTITDSTITISETLGFMEISNAAYTYSVKSSDTIEIQGKKFNVAVSDGVLIITPGFNGSRQDVWYSSALPPDTSEGSDSENSTDSNTDNSSNNGNGML